MSASEPVVGLSAFEEWWADLSPEFDVDPDYPLTDDHKDMAQAGWDARQPEIDALTQAQRDQAERLAALERQNVRLRAVLRRVLVNRPNWEHREGILVVTEGWWMHWEAEATAALTAEPEGA